jgi:hypothetical protein
LPDVRVRGRLATVADSRGTGEELLSSIGRFISGEERVRAVCPTAVELCTGHQWRRNLDGWVVARTDTVVLLDKGVALVDRRVVAPRSLICVVPSAVRTMGYARHEYAVARTTTSA